MESSNHSLWCFALISAYSRAPSAAAYPDIPSYTEELMVFSRNTTWSKPEERTTKNAVRSIAMMVENPLCAGVRFICDRLADIGFVHFFRDRRLDAEFDLIRDLGRESFALLYAYGHRNRRLPRLAIPADKAPRKSG